MKGEGGTLNQVVNYLRYPYKCSNHNNVQLNVQQLRYWPVGGGGLG